MKNTIKKVSIPFIVAVISISGTITYQNNQTRDIPQVPIIGIAITDTATPEQVISVLHNITKDTVVIVGVSHDADKAITDILSKYGVTGGLWFGETMTSEKQIERLTNYISEEHNKGDFAVIRL